jgi:hypothetical protein
MKLPELKRPDLSRGRVRSGPELRMPDFIVDLYADLRDRRLLPLVALLLVAIVAAPILIGGSKKKDQAPAASAQSGVKAASFSVVPAATELQEYKKRLAHRRSVNPFDPFAATKHRTPSRAELRAFENAESDSGSVAPEAEATSSAPASSAPAGGAPAESSGGGSSPGTTTSTEEPKKVVKATLKAQVGVAAVIKAGYDGAEPKELEVEDQTRLPQGKPAIVYDGTSKKGGALFLMTSQVSEFTGEGHCVLGGSVCQVVELKVGKSETFTIGYGETHYSVLLVGFNPIVKEEVIEAEGKKVRVPNHGAGKSQNETKGGTEGSVTEPSPRLLLR